MDGRREGCVNGLVDGSAFSARFFIQSTLPVDYYVYVLPHETAKSSSSLAQRVTNQSAAALLWKQVGANTVGRAQDWRV